MVQRNIVKRVNVIPEEPQEEFLEEITYNVERKMIQDYRGRRVMAHRIGKITQLKYKHLFNSNRDEYILAQAPAGANAYEISEEREGVRNSDEVVYSIQYFKITGRIYDPRFSKTFADLEREEVDLGDAHLGYDNEEIFFSKREVK